MGNPEKKATLGHDIVQRQANEKNEKKHGEPKGVFKQSINYEVKAIELLSTYILMIELCICTNIIK
jgi:hypothetical protein